MSRVGGSVGEEDHRHMGGERQRERAVHSGDEGAGEGQAQSVRGPRGTIDFSAVR